MITITITIDDVDRLKPAKRDALAELLTGIVADKPSGAQPVTRPTPASAAAPPPPTPAPPAPAATTPSAPASPSAARRGGRPTHGPGTQGHLILTDLADHDGVFRGSILDFVDTLGVRSPTGAAGVVRQLAAEQLVELTRPSPRVVTRIALTTAGWRHVGREAPPVAQPRTATDPAASQQSAPEIPDLGPIERRPFDPDAARVAAGEAV